MNGSKIVSEVTPGTPFKKYDDTYKIHQKRMVGFITFPGDGIP